MAQRRSAIVTGPEPQGRPRVALLGILLALGGVIFAALLAQGGLGLPGLSGLLHTTPLEGSPTTTGTATELNPHGAPPAGFAAYRDPQRRFALYLSTTWQAQTGTVTLAGKTVATTLFNPTGTKRPQWRIALPATTIATGQLASATSAILSAEGGANVATTSGPTQVNVGGKAWTRIELAMQINGAAVHVAAWYRAANSGSALVIAESLDLNFATTDTQDFTPMLASLNLGD